jgi:hypothetical protein
MAVAGSARQGRLPACPPMVLRLRPGQDDRVPDRKPPRLNAGEFETLLGLLQYQRESLISKIAGAGETAARTSPVPSGTTLLWLVKHLAQAETRWLVNRFAGEGAELPGDAVLPRDTVESVIEQYRAASARADAAARTGRLDEFCRADEAEPAVNLRWVLAHLLEETARHAGHADILRELIDGSTGR